MQDQLLPGDQDDQDVHNDHAHDVHANHDKLSSPAGQNMIVIYSDCFRTRFFT